MIYEQPTDGSSSIGIFQGNNTTSLEKNGAGKLSLNVGNSSAFQGDTLVFAGELNANGTLSSSNVTVSSGATFSGNNSVNDLTNNGRVSPGNSIGTINVLGNYVQDPNAILVIEINDQGQSDLLAVTGSADLNNGTLRVEPEPGLYMQGDLFTFLTANDLLGSSFGPLSEDSPQDFDLIYNRGVTPEFVQLLVTNTVAVPPTPVDELPGNAGNVGGYLFPTNNFPTSNSDYLNVIRSLTALSPDAFEKALLNLSPAQFGALSLGNLNKDILFADPYVTLIEDRMWCDRCASDGQKRPQGCPAEEERSYVWVTQLGEWYRQDGIQEQYGFQDNTYGFNLGGGYLFSNDLFLTGGGGYSHSNLRWKNSAGESVTNTMYTGISLGYSKKTYFVNLLSEFALNWFSTDREIHFSDVDRTAHSFHRSYDLLFRLDGGYKFAIKDNLNLDGPILIVPEGRLSYLNIFEEGYCENGASSLDLKVDSKTTSYLQPEILVKFMKEFYTKNACFVPMIKAGYVAKVPLSSATYKATLKNVDLSGKMSVKSFDWTSNQLLLGAGMVYKRLENFTADLNYETHLFDKSQVHQAKV